jgi:hypothetical protein
VTENTARAPRGRPRGDRARRAVLEAAGDILMESGVTAFTMEAVAARAGSARRRCTRGGPPAARWPSTAASPGSARRILRDGIAAGEIRDDIDVSATLDQLFGPLYHRLVSGHEPLTAALARRLVDQVMTATATGDARWTSST